MRAGTSRGPFFLAEHLPQDIAQRDRILIEAIGAGHPTQINGLGGGTTLTSKVAIVSKSTQPDCDVDYLFAQVGVAEAAVDTRPNCGNMLSGVGPFAIEQGLVKAEEGNTTVKIFNVNTGAKVHATIQTPNKEVRYEGDFAIDGVPGSAAPVYLSFLEVWGAVTGQLFPTGSKRDLIQGVEVTCIDAAMPMVIMSASALGVRGDESAQELDAIPGLIERLQSIRIEAGAKMGLGDVSNSVIPKPVLVSSTGHKNSLYSRYFTPKKCHTSHAVTGAIGVATAFVTPGTVANEYSYNAGEHLIDILHPAGKIQIALEVQGNGSSFAVTKGSVVRTVKKIMEGSLVVSD